jgi:hypothetical protein
MPAETRDSRYYRDRAEKARAKAHTASNGDLRAIYSGLARSYEKLADAEERVEMTWYVVYQVSELAPQSQRYATEEDAIHAARTHRKIGRAVLELGSEIEGTRVKKLDADGIEQMCAGR